MGQRERKFDRKLYTNKKGDYFDRQFYRQIKR